MDQTLSEAKRAILADYARKYNLKTFVETGTYMGDTIGAMLNLPFEKLYSIELSDKYYYQAVERFKNESRVVILEGDAELVLPRVLGRITTPTLFWLDSHGDACIGPILSELRSIMCSGLNGVILVDDMDQIEEPIVILESSDWKSSLIDGILRLVNVD